MPVACTILPTAHLAILTRPLSPLRRYRSAWWCFRWGNKGKSLSARSELWGGWSMTSPKESVKSWIRAEACVLALSCRSRTPFVNMPLEQCKTNAVTCPTSPWHRQNTQFCSDPGLVADSFGWDVIDHPPDSSDLAPSDFPLFLHLQ